jgi:ankyrin repeat protein
MKASVGLDALEERVIMREMGSLEQVQRALSECFGSSVAVRLNDYVPLMMPKNAASADVDVDSYTLLHLASWNGHADAVRALLEAGVDPNKPTLLQQQSALMLASRRGHYECVALLLATNRVDVCQSAADGRTALMAAVGANQAGVLQLLLEQGASDRGAGGWMGLSAGAAAEAIGGENDVTRMIRAYESEFMGNVLPVHGCKCVASWPGIYAKSWYVLQYALLID